MDQHHQDFSNECSNEPDAKPGTVLAERIAVAVEQHAGNEAAMPHSVLEMIEQVEQQLHRIRDAQREQDENIAHLNDRFEAVRRAESDLEEQQRALDEQRASLEVQQQALSEERQSIDAEREKWTQDRSEEETRLARQRSELDEREANITHRAEEFERQITELDGRERRLNEQREQFHRERDALQQRLEHAEQHAQEQAGRVESLQQQLHERSAELESISAERESLRSQVNDLQNERDALSGEREAITNEKQRLESEHESFETQLKDSRDALEALRRELTKREELAEARRAEVAEANRRADESAQAVQDRDDRLSALTRELADRDARIESLNAEMATAREQMDRTAQALREQDKQVEQQADLATQFEQREREIASLKESVAKERAERERIERERDDRLCELNEKIDRAEHTSSEYESKMKDLRAKAKRVDAVAKHTMRRQARLKRMRKLLRQHRGVNKAETASREQHAKQMRNSESERVKIAAARYALETAESRMKKQWARQRSIVITGWLTLLILANIAISWTAANAIAPPQRSAHITLEARTHDNVALNEEKIAQWRRAQTSLLQDEGFHRTLARRLADRRVMDEPTESRVRSMVKERLRMDANPDGSLTLTLAGHDRRALPATLDVLATTLSAESQRLAGRRGDASWTAVRSTAGNGDGAHLAALNRWSTNDRRIIWAGPIFLLTLTASMAAIMFIHRRLIQTKRIFDEQHSTFIDDALAKS